MLTYYGRSKITPSIQFNMQPVSLWKLALTTLSLSSATAGFVVDVFDTTDCTGAAREVNVWDNTCAGWMGGFRSVRVKVFGGSNQHAYFCPTNGCDGRCSSWWARGKSPEFQIGSCLGGFPGYNSAGSFTF